MVILQTKSKAQQYAFTKDIGRIFGYKDPVKLLKGFRDYADGHPKAFGPYKPYLKNREEWTHFTISSVSPSTSRIEICLKLGQEASAFQLNSRV